MAVAGFCSAAANTSKQRRENENIHIQYSNHDFSKSEEDVKDSSLSEFGEIVSVSFFFFSFLQALSVSFSLFVLLSNPN